MNDVQIAANLRARLPGALAELFDAYSDRLFRYCWNMLRSREIAQIALRDTLVVAEARIARLADPELLGPWLYALARAQCRRRRAVQPSLADEPLARPSQRDADSRLMAWKAVAAMAAEEIEALDLTCRHDVDLGPVLGLSAQDAQALVARARHNLERALGAEILTSRGAHACPDRAEMMSGWAGPMTPDMRDRVLKHALGCHVCGPGLPRNVSAARVFALLPAPALSPRARAEVLDFCADHRIAAYRECAVEQTSALGDSGFPLPSGPVAAVRPPSALRTGRRSGRRPAPRPARSGGILAAAGSIAAAAAIAAAIVLAGVGGRTAAVRDITPAMTAASPAAAAAQPPTAAGTAAASPGGHRRPATQPSPWAVIAGTTGGPDEAMLAGANQPFRPASTPAQKPGTRQRPASAQGSGPAPGAPGSASAGMLTVSPVSLALGAGSTGQITLAAVGGPVSWSASPSAAQLSPSASAGTLQAGQRVTLEVTISRGRAAGSAVIFLASPFSVPQAVEVSWAARPTPSGSDRPGHLTASPTPSGSDRPGPPAASPSRPVALALAVIADAVRLVTGPPDCGPRPPADLGCP